MPVRADIVKKKSFLILSLVLLAGVFILRKNHILNSAPVRVAIVPVVRSSDDPRIIPVLDSGVWRLPSQFSANNSPMPKILHQTFRSEMVYENYVPLIASCLTLNRDWKYYLWRDSDAELLIIRHYPHFLNKYRNYTNNLEKSDSVRYIVLHHFGGIYLDMDVECIQPFFPALSELPAFLDQERIEQTNIVWSAPFHAMNSVMGSVPGYPFFNFMIDAMLQVSKTGSPTISTGPVLLTEKYRKYVGIKDTKPVAIMDPRVLSPLLSKNNNWTNICKGPFSNPKNPTITRGCHTLASKNWSHDDSDSCTLAVHRFLHLGYRFAAADRRGKVNLTRLFPDRVNFYG